MVESDTRKRDPGHEKERVKKWEYLKTMKEREGIERIYLSCSSFSVWSLSSNWALRLLLAAVCLLISLLALCGEKESHIYPIIWYPIVHDSFMSIEPSGCLMRMLFHICFTEIYTSPCSYVLCVGSSFLYRAMMWHSFFVQIYSYLKKYVYLFRHIMCVA